MKKIISMPVKIMPRLVLLITFIIYLTGGIIILVSGYTNTFFSIEKMHNQSRNLVQIASGSLGYSTWNLDDKQSLTVVQSILREKNAVAINVFDKNIVLISVSKNQKGEIIVDHTNPYVVGEEAKGIFLVTEPTIFRDIEIGRVEYFYSNEYVMKDVNVWNIYLVSGTVIISLFISLVFNIMIKRLFFYPLVALASNVQKITKSKDYTTQLEKKNNDEIGFLHDDINLMLSTITKGQEELAQTKSLLQGVIESMPSILIVANEKNEILLWNKAAEETTKIKAHDIIGHNINEFGSDLEFYLEVFANSKNPACFFRQKLTESEKTFYDVSIFPLAGEGISGAVIRADNVTDQLNKEHQLEQSQKMETIGTLAGGLAHDFNNVLAGVLGSASLIQMEIESEPKKSISEIQDLVNAIELSGKRASTIVQQLLTLARRSDPDSKPCDLILVLKNVIKIGTNTFDKSIEIDSDFPFDNSMIIGDPGQLEQVMLNLCVNSCHAMTIMRPKNDVIGGILGIKINRFISDNKFRVRHPGAADAYWKVSISDTGVGMTEDIIQKIFDPFFTTKEKGQGTGLGLPIVYSIIKQHFGVIEIDSEFGKGTTFNVFLPMYEGVVTAIESDRKANILYHGKGRILIIDDEPIIRATARAFLERSNFIIEEAENGVEAIKKISFNRVEYNLVILDLVMPKKSGKETYYEIKKLCPDLPVIISSGFKQDGRIQELLDDGADAFLKKPYTIHELIECVIGILDKNKKI